MLRQFDRHFLPFAFATEKTVIAALSGGSDSTALVLALNDFLKRRHPEVRLKAVTVDHGLRAGSAAEAQAAARFCAGLGIDHDIVNWTGPKPQSGISASARLARYRLLAETAEKAGARMIVTGHTLNDQAETVAMRERRGTGRGSAGMADATLFDGRTWILRPLLGVSRADLRAMLAAKGVDWADDPGNDDLQAERIAIRRAIEAEGEAALLRRGEAIAGAQAERRRRSEAASALAERHFTMQEPGLLRLDADFPADSPAAGLLLRAALAMAGGSDFLLAEDLAARLMQHLNESRTLRTALGGAVIEKRRDGLFMYREWRGKGPGGPVRDGIWDGRFGVADGEAPFAKGQGGRAKGAGRLADGARDAEPAQGGLERLVSPWARFLPAFDFVLVSQMARLTSARIPPDLPYADHFAVQAS
ncbi:MAG: tRNA lysidine(34) synthetase TilS [Rhizobiaceae bacterium]